MFNVKVEGLNIRFTFRHLTDLQIEFEFEGKPIQAVTNCTLWINDVSFGGIALCSALDVFTKEKGRKLALARAIAEARQSIELSRTVREAIWFRYFFRDTPNHEFEAYYDGHFYLSKYEEGLPDITGTLDPPYQPKSGSDSLENMA